MLCYIPVSLNLKCSCTSETNFSFVKNLNRNIKFVYLVKGCQTLETHLLASLGASTIHHILCSNSHNCIVKTRRENGLNLNITFMVIHNHTIWRRYGTLEKILQSVRLSVDINYRPVPRHPATRTNHCNRIS